MTEFEVQKQEGYKPVYTEDDQVTVRRGTLRGLLDVASGSLDWGSGWLDNEQVEILREVAVLVGVDPVVVTPTNFTCQYNFDGVHDWRVYDHPKTPRTVCARCGREQ